MKRLFDGTSEGKSMNEEKNPKQLDVKQPEGLDRRELVRKGARVAYVIPAVLAAVKATERPAYAAPSGSPVPVPHVP
jgi:hypothetical protein